MRIRVSVAAVVCSLAGGLFVSAGEPVQAQGLFQRLFNPQPRYSERRANLHKEQALAEARKVRITGPRYYGYKPDKIVNASFKSLAEFDTASNDPDAVPEAVTTAFAAASAHLSDFRMRTLEPVAAAIKTHYHANPEFIWVSDGKVNEKARKAIAELARADDYGLSSRDYEVQLPSASFSGDDADAREKELVEFEITLSAKVLTYVFDAKRGRIDPNRISGYHDFTRKTVDLETVIGIVAQTDGIERYLSTRSPGNEQFTALAEELKRLRATSQSERIEIAEGTFLKHGRSSAEVANIVAAIRLRGSDKLKTEHAETLAGYDGSELYSDDLMALVRDFQRENRLKPDGIVGKATIRALTSFSVEDKIRKVELAMERARWLPRDLGDRHVFINQPAYTASYLHKGRDPMTMRVVVGKKSNQTSFFMDYIETVEYNPYWGVPRSIIVNEMLPKLYQDPTYLDRLGYEVSTASGRQISSAAVDWYDVGANGAPINVRQRPGRSNALGELKILFPNKHAIYMHDTPSKSLFKKDRRAFSHGCVRLHDPRGMAAAVLGKSKEYIASRIAQGKNDADPVPGKIPVYVAYFTAWPNPEGTVEYFDDMYARDKYLTRALDATDQSRHAAG
jgi:murein L,D-transpeptidase YcbB/YkuD